MKNNNWVRGAMLLAVGLVLQALRLVIPMPLMAVCNDRGAVAGNGVFSRAAAASVFDTGSGCRQLGDGISVCPLLGKGDHHRRASF